MCVGKADLGVFRPSTARWLIDRTRDGGTDLDAVFGASGDVALRDNGWILDALPPN